MKGFSHMKHSIVSILMVVLVLFSTTGCSLFAPWKESITVDSEPQGAQVIIPGQRLTTPCVLTVPCNKEVVVILKKEGYSTATYNIRPTLGICGVLDVAGLCCWLIPGIGLFTPGAFTLDQHIIYAPLAKDAPSEKAPAKEAEAAAPSTP